MKVLTCVLGITSAFTLGVVVGGVGIVVLEVILEYERPNSMTKTFERIHALD